MASSDEQNEPLLKKVVKYYENCPGCKVEERKEKQKDRPLTELILLALVVLCNALPISSLFPFVYFMVRDFHIGKTEDIGYYAGYIGSSFMFGRFLTSVLWGMAADKYGRKPIMFIGVSSVILFNTLFGMSTNFWMAISMRFLLGSFNGLLGPVKAYASEVCRDEHQALGLSVVGTMWGIGLIIGPALGGFLAQPADKYPTRFSQNSLFGRFPYLLPCLCISIIALVVLVTTFWLPVTVYTGTFLLLNNSASQDQRGAANGLALTGMSLFKTFGPAGGGSVFAWAQKRQNASFLPGDQSVFFFLNVILVIVIAMTFEPFLPRLTNRRNESEKQRYSKVDKEELSIEQEQHSSS